jgi:hypothetical protein
MHLITLEEAEIISSKDSDTRIKPLALTNGHGRYSGFHFRPHISDLD